MAERHAWEWILYFWVIRKMTRVFYNYSVRDDITRLEQFMKRSLRASLSTHWVLLILYGNAVHNPDHNEPVVLQEQNCMLAHPRWNLEYYLFDQLVTLFTVINTPGLTESIGPNYLLMSLNTPGPTDELLFCGSISALPGRPKLGIMQLLTSLKRARYFYRQLFG